MTVSGRHPGYRSPPGSNGLAWGDPGYGKLGFDATGISPVAPIPSDYYVDDYEMMEVAAGAYHSAALLTNGRVVCWGLNGNGQLGRPGPDSTLPVGVVDEFGEALDNVIAISCGAEFTIALRADGSVWAWGLGDAGQLGDGTSGPGNSRPFAAPMLFEGVGYTGVAISAFVGIAAGHRHCLLLTAGGGVLSCGANEDGQLGTGDLTPSSYLTPATMASGAIIEFIFAADRVKTIAAGGRHSLFVRSDGSVWACGANDSGQLGFDYPSGSLYARIVPGISKIISVAAGGAHSLAVDAKSELFAWGDNSSGQLALPCHLKSARARAPTLGSEDNAWAQRAAGPIAFGPEAATVGASSRYAANLFSCTRRC